MKQRDLEWNYSQLADSYDKRADYSDDAIDALLLTMEAVSSGPVADIGAGTGKLTRKLLERGWHVMAVEPNDAMRAYGIENTRVGNVTWSNGTGEETGLPDRSVGAAFFGSSFNVLNREKALVEVARIVRPEGWFACMWNHRDLNDPHQLEIERIIQTCIPDYHYGTRREDQSAVIEESGLFGEVKKMEASFVYTLSTADYIDAWRSHATLARQAGDRFEAIIDAIRSETIAEQEITVPYTTRVWFAQLRA